MLTVLLVDDEPVARSRLKRLLAAEDDVEVVAEAGNGKQAVQACRNHRPDLVLLDIRMPGMDGMEAADAMQQLESAPSIVFCTAYDDQALKAFERDALDYLVKPVRAERLRHALVKVRQFRQAIPADGRTHLTSRIGERVELIPVDQIIYLLSEHKYTTVGTAKGTAVVDDSLVSLEEEFEDLFFRIHRNALVSVRKLAGLRKTHEGNTLIQLRDTDQELEVSRRNLPAVRRLLKRI